MTNLFKPGVKCRVVSPYDVSHFPNDKKKKNQGADDNFIEHKQGFISGHGCGAWWLWLVQRNTVQKI